MKEALFIGAGTRGAKLVGGELQPYLEFHGKTCLEHVVEAAMKARSVGDIYIWGDEKTVNRILQEHIKQYMQKIVANLTREADGQQVPVVLFTKGGCQWLELMADTGADALGLDWSTDLAMARKRVGDRVALQGNLDPAVLYATPEVIREQVGQVLAHFGKGSGHVFNLGHGITPDVAPENAGALVDAVHELSAQYHQ